MVIVYYLGDIHEEPREEDIKKGDKTVKGGESGTYSFTDPIVKTPTSSQVSVSDNTYKM